MTIFRGKPIGRIGAKPVDRFRMAEVEKRAKALELACKINRERREELPLIEVLKREQL